MNIILIGFMGSGKTTIGEALAKRQGLKFIDTDKVIEDLNNTTIKDIFSNFGEAHFRELEQQTIDDLKNTNDCVIAVGGGAVMHHNNFDTLKKVGTTVFLDAPIQKIISNIKGKFRPLVGNTIDENKLCELLDSRYTTYKKADMIIKTESLSIEETVDEIVKSLFLDKLS
jgi:shikimate kinase